MPGDGPWPVIYGIEMRGNAVVPHDDPDDRPEEIFGGTTTAHTGPTRGHRSCSP